MHRIPLIAGIGACALTLLGWPSQAQVNFEKPQWEAKGFRHPHHTTLTMPSSRRAKFTHAQPLNLIMLRRSGWTRRTVEAEVAGAAKIFAQCGIRFAPVTLTTADAPVDWRAPPFNELPAGVERPVVFFVHSLTVYATHHIAFSINQNACQTDPTTCNIVWIDDEAVDNPLSKRVRGIFLAHELAHLLGNVDEHNETRGNILANHLRDRGAAITPEQCAAFKQYPLLKKLD